jgi:recombinational DNA repair protein (RecF pathway)
MTSLINTTKEKSICVICGESKTTKVFDQELNGRVCNDCIDPLLVADAELNRVRGISRPQRFQE